MKNKSIKICRTAFQQAAHSLNAALPELGEGADGPIKKLIASMTAADGELAALEGQETEDAAHSLSAVTTSTQQIVSALTENLNRCARETHEAKQQAHSLNAKVTDFEGRLTSGALVPKEKAQELADLARKEGALEAENKFKVAGTRRHSLSSAGVPLPLMDELLGGTDEEFKALSTTAGARHTDLKKRFHSLNGTPAMQRLCWAPEAEFKRDLELIEIAVKPSSVPGRAEPLLGGGGGGGTNKSPGAL